MRVPTESASRRWLGFELNILRRLKFTTIAIPFAGEPDLDWYLKFWNKQVLSNDLCQWAASLSQAFVENRDETLSHDEVAELLAACDEPRPGLDNPALGEWMSETDAAWFDNLRSAIQRLESPYRRALAVAHALRVADYVFSFQRPTNRLRRPLSSVFFQLWRSQRQIFDNGRDNRSLNLDATAFVRQTRADLMFTRFPDPRGIGPRQQWRELWLRGSSTEWQRLVEAQRGRLGDTVLSKQHYLSLVDNFLAEARRIPRWAISHTEDGFLSIGEVAARVRKFRRLESIYHKDFSEVVGGRNTYLLITR